MTLFSVEASADLTLRVIPGTFCMSKRRIAFSVLLVAACGGASSTVTPPPAPPPPPPVATVTLNSTAATLTPGQTLTLTATTKDATGTTVTGRTITWSTSASSVATVNSSGLVTAVATGTATVTATSEGQNASAAITVSPGAFIGPAGGTATAPNGNSSATIPAGALATSLAITVTPVANPQADARLAPGTAYDFGPTGTTFASPVTLAITYNPATLPAGTIQSQLRVHKLIGSVWTPLAGSTVNTSTHVVTGATSSFSTYAVLEVIIPVGIVEISPSSVDLPLGMQVQLNAVTKDAQGNTLTGRTVTWQSSAGSTATIGTTTGLVTSNAIGSTTITATSEGIATQMSLNVRSDPSARTLGLDMGAGSIYVQNRGLVVIPNSPDASCAIGNDQKGYCWGHNSTGSVGDGTLLDRSVPTPIALGSPLVDITVGGGFACALDTGKNAWCWGSNSAGMFGNGNFNSGSPTPIQAGNNRKFIDLAAGETHVCGIEAVTNFTYCWGQNAWGSLGIGVISATPPTAINVPTRISGDPGLVSLSVGNYGACGLTVIGAAYCWGSTGISVNAPGAQLSATAVPGGLFFMRLSVGWDHVCGLTVTHQLYCWGLNFYGQLGDGTVTDHTLPTLVGGGMTWRFVSAGPQYTCGITTDNRTFCWGGTAGGLVTEGENGNGTASGSLMPTQVSGSVPPLAVVSAGIQHACGLTVDGSGYCWGLRGDLGDGDYAYSAGPVKVTGAQNAQSVSRGGPIGCYVNTTKQLMCWAENEDQTSAQTPTFGSLLVKSVAAGGSFGAFSGITSSCLILDSNNRVSCWGYNGSGELGNGNTTSTTSPGPINSTQSFTSIAMHYQGACGVTNANALLCWGNQQTVPTPVMPGVIWASVFGNGDSGVCGISTNQAAYCGTLPSSLALIPGTLHWVMMTSSPSYLSTTFCGLTDTGDAYCMGDNSSGQIGDGTTTARATMTAVGGGLKFTQLIAGGYTTCGLTAAGGAYCWGDGTSGQLGVAPGISVSTPTLVPGGLQFAKLSGTSAGVCGATVDGSIYCWGTRAYSTLGNGELDDRRTPVPMSGSKRFLLYEPGSAALRAQLKKQP